MDVVNPRNEVLLVETEGITSLSSHSVEPVSHPVSIPANPITIDPALGFQLLRVLSSTPPERILAEIAELLAQAFGAEGCLISVQTRQYGMSKITSWLAKPYRTRPQQTEILSSFPNLEAATLKNGGVVISDVVESDLVPAWKALSVRSAMTVTTRFQNQVNGVICVMRSHPHSWTDSEVTTLTHVADQVATAISHVLLQQRVLKQAQFQGLLRQVTMALQNTVDLPQALQLALSETASVIQAERAFILRLKYWDPRQSVRSFDQVPKARVVIDCEWYAEGLNKPSEQAENPLSQSFWVSECVLCQAGIQSTDKSITLGDKSEFPYPKKDSGIAPIFNPEEMPALMLVPLESKNRLLGFIALQQSVPRTWQPEEIELTELVAAQISSAIMQSETLRQVESLVEERTAQLQQSLELQAKLYDITRKQIDKLREMNQRMDEFLSTLSHELRTPLTSMMLAIRMLRQANLSPDRRQQYLNILEQQCAQETNLINDLLALQELETKQVAFQLQRVELQHIVDDLAQAFQQRWASKGLQLKLNLPKRSLVFNTDLASLNRILLELLTNAGKYSDPNSKVSLSVTTQPGQQVQISICNTGSGISEDEMPHIFDKFRRCQGMTQNAVPGTGLGLALVKSLVQHLNGTIEASSIASGQSYETCFTVTLPQNLEIADS